MPLKRRYPTGRSSHNVTWHCAFRVVCARERRTNSTTVHTATNTRIQSKQRDELKCLTALRITDRAPLAMKNASSHPNLRTTSKEYQQDHTRFDTKHAPTRLSREIIWTSFSLGFVICSRANEAEKSLDNSPFYE
jgi:hypothetical protein